MTCLLAVGGLDAKCVCEVRFLRCSSAHDNRRFSKDSTQNIIYGLSRNA